MKKSVIVFYFPIDLGATDPVITENQRLIQKDLANMKKTDMAKNFEAIVIQDSRREKIEVEVFFNPYQE